MGSVCFLFTPIQSDYGRALALKHGIDPDNPQSNAVLVDGTVNLRSDSAIAALSRLPRYGWVRAFRIVPKPLRDWAYGMIARNRYRWFGRHDVCDIGGAAYMDRVVGWGAPGRNTFRRPQSSAAQTSRATRVSRAIWVISKGANRPKSVSVMRPSATCARMPDNTRSLLADACCKAWLRGSAPMPGRRVRPSTNCSVFSAADRRRKKVLAVFNGQRAIVGIAQHPAILPVDAVRRFGPDRGRQRVVNRLRPFPGDRRDGRQAAGGLQRPVQAAVLDGIAEAEPRKGYACPEQDRVFRVADAVHARVNGDRCRWPDPASRDLHPGLRQGRRADGAARAEQADSQRDHRAEYDRQWTGAFLRLQGLLKTDLLDRLHRCEPRRARRAPVKFHSDCLVMEEAHAIARMPHLSVRSWRQRGRRPHLRGLGEGGVNPFVRI
jgi:predicted DCC family thiol-disulfide oxidoreductase YuxK